MAKKTEKRNHAHTDMPGGASAGTAEEATELNMEESEEETPEAAASKEQELEKKISALNERHVRLLAEYDNYRKRTAREMECVADIASERLIREFLPILDSLDRATEHRNDKTTFEEYVRGIALIEEQLRKVLSQAGLRKMDVVGEPFDPAIHDAILQIESPDAEPGAIVGEAEKGYTLNGKVVRHPKVIISK